MYLQLFFYKNLLRKTKLLRKQTFKINIKKNIPHGSGLGGGSSNAADLLNHLNLIMKLGLNKNQTKKLANKIGFDVPINLEMKNTFLTGQKGEILRTDQQFKFNVLIVFPNLFCSTRKIYQKNNKFTSLKPISYFRIKSKKKLINSLKNDNNDLEETVIRFYPKIKKIIDNIKIQKGCLFSRITGSGSACIGIFSNMNTAIYAQKLIKRKYPKYWCYVSKTM